MKRPRIGTRAAPDVEDACTWRLAEHMFAHERNDDPVRAFDIRVRRLGQVEGEGGVHGDAPQSWLRPPGGATRNFTSERREAPWYRGAAAPLRGVPGQLGDKRL